MTQSETIAPDRALPPPESPFPRPSRGRVHRFATRRRVTIGLVVVLVVGGGLGAWFATRPASASAISTRIVTVAYGTIEQTASATGTIAAANTADLDFAVAGRVTAVDVAVGQSVTAGQALATVDSTALSAQVDEAQATLDSDEAKLSSDQSSTSTSAAQVTADESAVTAAQASLSAAQESLGDATLTSTITGTVATLNLTVGQQVSGSSSGSGTSSSSSTSGGSGASSTASGGGGGGFSSAGASTGDSTSSSSSSSTSSSQVVVTGTGSYVVDASVDDTEVGELATGDQATITPEGSTTPVYGQVASVGVMATQSSGVASFPVVIDVTGSPTGLYSGDTADVSIIVKELQNVLVVPTAAIRFSGGNTDVVVQQGAEQVTRTVSLGAASGGDTQVTSGLSAGDKVVERIVTTPRTPGAVSGGTTGRFGGGGGGFTGGGGFGGGG